MKNLKEKISEVIHDKLWSPWAKILLNEENLSFERSKRWSEQCLIHYDDLTEEMKDLDRKFADEILPTIKQTVFDRYLDQSECIKRLINDYLTHNSLFVAFDFDDTVFDYHNLGDEFPKLEDILKLCKKNNFKLILFTANENEKLEEIIKYCKEKGFEPDYVNENPIMKTRKPYYNILLDDRAGLNDAYQTLKTTLNILNLN